VAIAGLISCIALIVKQISRPQVIAGDLDEGKALVH
jgi:hypothetical protein